MYKEKERKAKTQRRDRIMQEENRIFMSREQRERDERYRFTHYTKPPEKPVKEKENKDEPND